MFSSEDNTKKKDKADTKSKSNLVRHRYKCDVGKKSYTFKSKKEINSSFGLSNKITNGLIKGEMASNKIKIHLI